MGASSSVCSHWDEDPNGADFIVLFAEKLLIGLTMGGGGGVTAFSPVSAAAVLAMAAAGADGASRDGLLKALQLVEDDAEDAVERLAWLTKSVRSGFFSRYTLLMANAVFCSSTLLPDFAREVRSVGSVQELESADQINDWVASNTKGEITKLFDTLGRDVALILINALYFKGSWVHAFDPELTRSSPFYLPGGSVVQCKLMRNKAKYNITEGHDWRAVELTYKGNAVHAIIVLPKGPGTEPLPAEPLLGHMREVLAATANSEGRTQLTELLLPKFRIEISLDLRTVLCNLGAADAFSAKADFRMMTEDDIFIDRVLQRCVVDVDEEGTVAAAASAVTMKRSLPPQPYLFHADRPFVFMLVHCDTSCLLFVALVNEPSAF